MKRSFVVLLLVSGCAIHHVTAYVPDSSNAVQTSGAEEASASCAEASTPAETAICASPALVAANRRMVAALQADVGPATLFGRDAVLASQRGWLLRLPAQCGVAPSPATGSAHVESCLQSALSARTEVLRNWPVSPVRLTAVAQYVSFHAPADAGPQPDPGFCATFAQRANDALRRSGQLDPTDMGYRELAGTHGPQAAGPFSVDLYDANAYALFQRRARGVSIGGTALAISPISLTQLIEAQSTANQGGRFSAFASQTGDYGSVDVFEAGGRTAILAADPWGFTTPAAPGEAAHAGIWTVTGTTVSPTCLFDTYTRPAEPGPFQSLANFTAWQEVLDQIRASADLPLGGTIKRDQGQLSADAAFTVLHMPLLAVQEANAADQVAWLRRRHDDVLDALFAWSGKDAANKALFDRAFALLRPAATDLVHSYQTAQGLTGPEATQAGGIAVMELLYQATTTVAPDLGASPARAVAYKARYPILAAPQ